MESYPRAAVERTMKVQEVIMRAMAKKITWGQAGEIIGLCERQMRRWKERYEEFGYDGLFDRRRRITRYSEVILPAGALARCLATPPLKVVIPWPLVHTRQEIKLVEAGG